MQDATRTAGRSFDPLVLGLLALSLAANVYLGLRLAERPASIGQRAPIAPAVGTLVGDFAVKDLKGNDVSFKVGETGLNTVYYMFTPSCPWCARNLENIRAVVAGAGSTYRVVAVSLDPQVDAYIDANRINFSVFVNPSRTTTGAYGLGSVPQTVVVSPQGRVLHHWKGAYGPKVLEEVSEALSVQLPGLIEPPARNN